MIDNKKQILIVDDSMEQIDFLTEILIEEYNILSAFNGVQALKITKNNPAPDLILLDIVIPAPDGYEVCSILKADPRTKHIPILLITGLSNKSILEKSVKAGAAGYINKPYEIKEIKDRIEKLI